jgi:hypothetical protein
VVFPFAESRRCVASLNLTRAMTRARAPARLQLAACARDALDLGGECHSDVVPADLDVQGQDVARGSVYEIGDEADEPPILLGEQRGATRRELPAGEEALHPATRLPAAGV